MKYIVKYWYLRKGYFEGWDTNYAEFDTIEAATDFMTKKDADNLLHDDQNGYPGFFKSNLFKQCRQMQTGTE